MKATITPLQRAIDAAGSSAELARLLNISPQAISQWSDIPLNRVLDVESVTGVPRHLLRPDFFPRVPAKRRRAS